MKIKAVLEVNYIHNVVNLNIVDDKGNVIKEGNTYKISRLKDNMTINTSFSTIGASCTFNFFADVPERNYIDDMDYSIRYFTQDYINL